MMDIHKEKLMAKVENMAVTYEKYRLIPLDEIACDMWETDDHTLRSEPGNEAAWRPVHIGDPWGKEYGYAQGLNGHGEIALYVDTFEEVDRAFAQVVAKGAAPVLEPVTQPWGQRTCYVADPEGNLVEIGSFNRPFGR